MVILDTTVVNVAFPTLRTEFGATLSTSQSTAASPLLGFERAYRLTFYLAPLAILVGALLPGWPSKWAGRAPALRTLRPEAENVAPRLP